MRGKQSTLIHTHETLVVFSTFDVFRAVALNDAARDTRSDVRPRSLACVMMMRAKCELGFAHSSLVVALHDASASDDHRSLAVRQRLVRRKIERPHVVTNECR